MSLSKASGDTSETDNSKETFKREKVRKWQQTYKHNLKMYNPEKYEECKAKHRSYMRKYRQKLKTAGKSANEDEDNEKKQIQRLKHRVYLKSYRQNLKDNNPAKFEERKIKHRAYMQRYRKKLKAKSMNANTVNKSDAEEEAMSKDHEKSEEVRVKQNNKVQGNYENLEHGPYELGNVNAESMDDADLGNAQNVNEYKNDTEEATKGKHCTKSEKISVKQLANMQTEGGDNVEVKDLEIAQTQPYRRTLRSSSPDRPKEIQGADVAEDSRNPSNDLLEEEDASDNLIFDKKMIIVGRICISLSGQSHRSKLMSENPSKPEESKAKQEANTPRDAAGLENNAVIEKDGRDIEVLDNGKTTVGKDGISTLSQPSKHIVQGWCYTNSTESRLKQNTIVTNTGRNTDAEHTKWDLNENKQDDTEEMNLDKAHPIRAPTLACQSKLIISNHTTFKHLKTKQTTFMENYAESSKPEKSRIYSKSQTYRRKLRIENSSKYDAHKARHRAYMRKYREKLKASGKAKEMDDSEKQIKRDKLRVYLQSYRKNLKINNPEKYEEQKLKHRIYVQKYRQRKKNESVNSEKVSDDIDKEKQKMRREKTRAYLRSYRKNLKINNPSKYEERKEKNRIYTQKYRQRRKKEAMSKEETKDDNDEEKEKIKREKARLYTKSYLQKLKNSNPAKFDERKVKQRIYSERYRQKQKTAAINKEKPLDDKDIEKEKMKRDRARAYLHSYRQKLKINNPEKYAECKAKHRVYAQRYRQKQKVEAKNKEKPKNDEDHDEKERIKKEKARVYLQSYRRNLKANNPDKYEECKAKQRVYSQRYRQKMKIEGVHREKDEEKEQIKREKARAYLQSYRKDLKFKNPEKYEECKAKHRMYTHKYRQKRKMEALNGQKPKDDTDLEKQKIKREKRAYLKLYRENLKKNNPVKFEEQKTKQKLCAKKYRETLRNKSLTAKKVNVSAVKQEMRSKDDQTPDNTGLQSNDSVIDSKRAGSDEKSLLLEFEYSITTDSDEVPVYVLPDGY